jgi:hypothetical protein
MLSLVAIMVCYSLNLKCLEVTDWFEIFLLGMKQDSEPVLTLFTIIFSGFLTKFSPTSCLPIIPQ